MYPNLRAELARKGISNRKLFTAIKMPETTFYFKLSGRGVFNLDEAQAIADYLGFDINYLFAKEAK